MAFNWVQAQEEADSTGLPGDNFSLQGALELFKQSASPEAFEKALNSEGNDVNNLDLNGDGETDYVQVIDTKDGNTHALILRAAVSETENQDIAVIELEKTGTSNAVLQIVGDEDIYGQQKIVEPAGEEDAGTSFISTGARYVHGPAATVEPSGIIVNVWLWPAVRFIYAPAYVVWRSPWSWRARPIWWRPWHPVRYSVFYRSWAPYRPRYVVVHTHRVIHARRVYAPVRVTSVTVRTRNQVAVTNYRSTRRTVTVSGRNHNGANHRQVQTTRKTTTVQSGHGNRQVKHSRTTVKKRR